MIATQDRRARQAPPVFISAQRARPDAERYLMKTYKRGFNPAEKRHFDSIPSHALDSSWRRTVQRVRVQEGRRQLITAGLKQVETPPLRKSWGRVEDGRGC